MPRGRMVVVVALGAVSLAATTSADSASSPLYTVAATQACLMSLPGAIAGLPPATPPSPPALFVYRVRPDRLLPHVYRELNAWYGRKGARAYEGMTLYFFKTAQAARASFKSLVALYGGKLMRNVVVAWDAGDFPRWSLRHTVLDCLRAGHAATRPTGSTPQAGLATFAGYWGGHTRGLRITPAGRGLEITDDGCCFRAYRLAFQILSVTGTLTRATAVYRTTSFTRNDRAIPKLRAGRLGKLLLRNGIVTNTLTRVFFCSDPAWGATGVCGA